MSLVQYFFQGRNLLFFFEGLLSQGVDSGAAGFSVLEELIQKFYGSTDFGTKEIASASLG